MRIKEKNFFLSYLEQLDLSQKYPAIFLSLKKEKIAGYHLVINVLKTFNDMLCLQMTAELNVREATQDVDNSKTKPRRRRQDHWVEREQNAQLQASEGGRNQR